MGWQRDSAHWSVSEIQVYEDSIFLWFCPLRVQWLCASMITASGEENTGEWNIGNYIYVGLGVMFTSAHVSLAKKIRSYVTLEEIAVSFHENLWCFSNAKHRWFCRILPAPPAAILVSLKLRCSEQSISSYNHHKPRIQILSLKPECSLQLVVSKIWW